MKRRTRGELPRSPGKPQFSQRPGTLQSVAALLFVLGALVRTASAEPAHHPVNLSFLYPLSTNRDPGISTSFRLNVFYARAGSVRGIDLGGLVARTDGDFRGLELALAHSWIGHDFRGLSATGLVGVVGGNARGLQFAGLVNFDRGRFNGAQAAGLFNAVAGDVRGVQFCSVYNSCEGDVRWLQAASVANVSAGSLTGIQLGSFNFAGRGATGAQFGLCNSATALHGVQAGILNLAGAARGTQIGIVNIAQRLDGLPLGLVNVVHDGGESDWLLLGSSLAAVSIGARTTVRGIYSMVSAGVGDLHDDESNTAFFDWHYGYAADLGSRWRVGGDLGFVHIIPQPNDDPEVNDRLHFAVQPRILAETDLGKRLHVLAGVGASVIWNEYSSNAAPETDPLVVLGISSK